MTAGLRVAPTFTSVDQLTELGFYGLPGAPTSPADLLHCNLLVARRLSMTSLRDESADLHPGVTLDQAVIGARARVRQGISIRRSVIFEDAVVDTDQDIDGMLISRERSVDVRSSFPHWPQGLYR